MGMQWVYDESSGTDIYVWVDEPFVGGYDMPIPIPGETVQAPGGGTYTAGEDITAPLTYTSPTGETSQTSPTPITDPNIQYWIDLYNQQFASDEATAPSAPSGGGGGSTSYGEPAPLEPTPSETGIVGVAEAVAAAREAVQAQFGGPTDEQDQTSASTAAAAAYQQAAVGAVQEAVAAATGTDLTSLYKGATVAAERQTLVELYGESAADLIQTLTTEQRPPTAEEVQQLKSADFLTSTGEVAFDPAKFQQAVQQRADAAVQERLESGGYFKAVEDELNKVWLSDNQQYGWSLPAGQELTPAQKSNQQLAAGIDTLGRWLGAGAEAVLDVATPLGLVSRLTGKTSLELVKEGASYTLGTAAKVASGAVNALTYGLAGKAGGALVAPRIDPDIHSEIADWVLGLLPDKFTEAVQETFARNLPEGDYSIVDTIGGLFDVVAQGGVAVVTTAMALQSKPLVGQLPFMPFAIRVSSDQDLSDIATLSMAGYAATYWFGSPEEQHQLGADFRAGMSWGDLQTNYFRPIATMGLQMVFDPTNLIGAPVGRGAHVAADIMSDAAKGTKRLTREAWAAESAAELAGDSSALVRKAEQVPIVGKALARGAAAATEPLPIGKISAAVRQADRGLSLVVNAAKADDIAPVAKLLDLVDSTTDYAKFNKVVGPELAETRDGHRLFDLLNTPAIRGDKEITFVEAVKAQTDTLRKAVAEGGDTRRAHANLVFKTSEYYRQSANVMFNTDRRVSWLMNTVNQWVKLNSMFYLSNTGYVVRNMFGNVLPMIVDGLMNPWDLPEMGRFILRDSSEWRNYARDVLGVDITVRPGGMAADLRVIQGDIRAAEAGLDGYLKQLGRAPTDRSRGLRAALTGGISEVAAAVFKYNAQLEQASREWIMMRASKRAIKQLNRTRSGVRGAEKGIYTAIDDSSVAAYLSPTEKNLLEHTMINGTPEEYETTVRRVLSGLPTEGAVSRQAVASLLVPSSPYKLGHHFDTYAKGWSTGKEMGQKLNLELGRSKKALSTIRTKNGIPDIDDVARETQWRQVIATAVPGAKEQVIDALVTEATVLDGIAASVVDQTPAEAKELLVLLGPKPGRKAVEALARKMDVSPRSLRAFRETYSSVQQYLSRRNMRWAANGIKPSEMLSGLTRLTESLEPALHDLRVGDYVETLDRISGNMDLYRTRLYGSELLSKRGEFDAATESLRTSGQKVYHGTTKKFEPGEIDTRGGPIYVSTDADLARRQGGRLGGEPDVLDYNLRMPPNKTEIADLTKGDVLPPAMRAKMSRSDPSLLGDMQRAGKKVIVTSDEIIIADPNLLKPALSPERVEHEAQVLVDLQHKERQTLKQAVLFHAQQSADFALHNYDQVFAWDLALKLVMPWEFWLTRSAAKWGLRIAQKPRVLAQTLRIRENLPALSEFLYAGVTEGDWDDRWATIGPAIDETRMSLPPDMQVYFRLPLPGGGDPNSPWARLTFDPLSPQVFPYLQPFDPFENEAQRKGWGDLYGIVQRLPAVSPLLMAWANSQGKFGPDAQAMPLGQTGFERDFMTLTSLPWVRGVLNSIPGAWVPETGLSPRQLPPGLWALFFPADNLGTKVRPNYTHDAQRILDQMRAEGELSAKELLDAYQLLERVIAGERVTTDGTPLEKVLSIVNTKHGWRAAGSALMGSPIYLNDKETTSYFNGVEELRALATQEPWKLPEWFENNPNRVSGDLHGALTSSNWDAAKEMIRRDAVYDELDTVQQEFTDRFAALTTSPTFWTDYEKLQSDRRFREGQVYQAYGWKSSEDFYSVARGTDLGRISDLETRLARIALGEETDYSPDAVKYMEQQLAQEREALVARELLNFYYKLPAAYTDPQTGIVDWKATLWAQEEFINSQQMLPPAVMRYYLSDAATPTEAVAEAWKDWAGNFYKLVESGQTREQAFASLATDKRYEDFYTTLAEDAFDKNVRRSVVFEAGDSRTWEEFVDSVYGDIFTSEAIATLKRTQLVVDPSIAEQGYGAWYMPATGGRAPEIRVSDTNAQLLWAEAYHAVWDGMTPDNAATDDLMRIFASPELAEMLAPHVADYPSPEAAYSDWQHTLAYLVEKVAGGDWTQLPAELHPYFEGLIKPGAWPDGLDAKWKQQKITLGTSPVHSFESLDAAARQLAGLDEYSWIDGSQQRKIDAFKQGRGESFFAGSTNDLVDSVEDALSLERANGGMGRYTSLRGAYDAARLALNNYRIEAQSEGTVGGPTYTKDAEYMRRQNEAERLRQSTAWDADMKRWYGSKMGGQEQAAQERIGQRLGEMLPAADLELGALDSSGNTIGLHIPPGMPNYYAAAGKQLAVSQPAVPAVPGAPAAPTATPTATEYGTQSDGLMYPSRSDPEVGRVAAAVGDLDRNSARYQTDRNSILNSVGATEQQLDDYYKRNDTPREMLERKLQELVVTPAFGSLKVLEDAGIRDRDMTNRIWESTTVTPEMLVAAVLGDPAYSSRGITAEMLYEVLDRNDRHVPSLQEWTRRNWTAPQQATQAAIDARYDAIDKLEAMEKELEAAVKRAPTSANAKAQAAINAKQAEIRKEIDALRLQLEAGKQPNPITLFEGTPDLLKQILSGKLPKPAVPATPPTAPTTVSGGGGGGGGAPRAPSAAVASQAPGAAVVPARSNEPDGTESPQIEAYKRDLQRARLPKSRQRLINIINALRAGLSIEEFVPRYGFGR